MPWWPDGQPQTDVVIGAGFDGMYLIDLRRDGVNALVAGTTGLGKSELLQTIVASLALANRPDQLTFVLVDYKGGRRSRSATSFRTPSAWSPTSTRTSSAGR